jgi:hypothetical protein
VYVIAILKAGDTGFARQLSSKVRVDASPSAEKNLTKVGENLSKKKTAESRLDGRRRLEK